MAFVAAGLGIGKHASETFVFISRKGNGKNKANGEQVRVCETGLYCIRRR